MSDIKFIQRNLKGMYYFGLWDYYEYKGWKKVVFEIYSKWLWSMILIFNISQIIEMFCLLGDFPLLMDNVGVTILASSFIFKTGTILFRKNRFERLLQVLRQEEKRSLNRPSKEVAIYYKNVEQNWFISRLFWILGWLTISMFCLARPTEYFIVGPQDKNGGRIPYLFSAWYPYDKYKSVNYQLTYLYQVTLGWAGANFTALGDTFIVAFKIFAIGQFRMMQCSIRNMHELTQKEEEMFRGKEVLDTYYKVVDIIKHHCRITEYVNDLDDLINPIIMMNFLVCSLMICAVGFEIIVAGSSVQLIVGFQYLTALLIQLFLFYWHANEVTLESINVGLSVGDSQWYRFSKRVKQALLLLNIRSQKPSILTVGRIYPMSLSTFLMILRATYSYLALFRNLYSEDN